MSRNPRQPNACFSDGDLRALFLVTLPGAQPQGSLLPASFCCQVTQVMYLPWFALVFLCRPASHRIASLSVVLASHWPPVE